MSKEKRFSLAVRILGGLCIALFIGVMVVFATAGFGLVSGALLVASLTGLVVPCVSAGESLLDVLGAIIELIAEGISTLAEAILDAFASLFG